MLINYENNPYHPGQGFFVLDELAPDLGDPAGLLFTLRRSSDNLTLGPGGWGRGESWLRPVAVTFRDAKIYLELGPAMNSHMYQDGPYRFALRTASGLEFVAELSLRGQPAAMAQSLGANSGPVPWQFLATPAARPKAATPASVQQGGTEEAKPKANTGATLGMLVGLICTFVVSYRFIGMYVLIFLPFLLVPIGNLFFPKGSDAMVKLALVLFGIILVVVVVVIVTGGSRWSRFG